MLERCPVPAVAELRLISLFDMRTQKPKTRNVWLITWEAVPSYRLEDLGRPRIVAILKPQISDSTLKKVLPILFTSESRLTFTEKIGVSFFAQQPLLAT